MEIAPVMPTSAKPTLVFDLDGTLVDTAHDLIGALNAALASEGVPAVPEAMVGHLVGNGAKVMIERGLAHHRVAAGSAQIDRLIQFFLAHYAENVAVASRPYPGVLAALDRFAAAGWTFAVCTNKHEALSKRLLTELGLIDRIAALTGGDTFAYKKPDPRHILSTIAKAGGTADDAIMVGDSRSDIDAAKAAGIPVVAVTFGYTDTPVAKLGPDVIIDHFDELWDAVEAIRARPAKRVAAGE
jgi:phosphoglycolate phosphatase